MSKAEKLLARMRKSKSGWGAKDLDSLYSGFGFDFREGKGHRLYRHPDYSQLTATVARHNDLPVGYVDTAVKLIDQLKELESQNE